ncbi:uncharacterized protein N7484_000599 [Penicillium longicatenatum]|uniref:uncharacterized protein n=1 Tax=Penicillium longicatenatum TaxID=1561947 RepID=UPI00254841CD|nr:uncharacterized protein N7484_000599 [Penicillium longicatenatum]KAJ5661227.1 hypothetical protein N7484_000599 [Penicillium longicatenatum]
MSSLPTQPRSWSKEDFTISTDKKYLSIPSINKAFGEDFMYWVNPVPEPVLLEIINNSFCLGLYRVIQGANSKAGSQPLEALEAEDVEQIGFARLVTDSVTFAYLTDVYVLPEYQGRGLGGWLLDCVNELLDPLPYLRWSMLRTSALKSQQSYEKRLGMNVLHSGDIKDGPVMMGKKGRAGRA